MIVNDADGFPATKLIVTNSVRIVVEGLADTVNEMVPGTVGPVVGLVKVMPDDPVAFQVPHAPGGVPGSGVICAVIVPLAPDPTAYGFCAFTEIVTPRQNAGDSGAWRTVIEALPPVHETVTVPIRPTNVAFVM